MRKDGLKKTEGTTYSIWQRGENTERVFSAQCWPMSGKKKYVALFAGSQASSVCPSEKDAIEMKMSMEHWWNDIDKVKQKYFNKNLSRCQFVRQNDPGWNSDISKYIITHFSSRFT